MFGISGFELLIIVTFALIIFGPDKLPAMGRTIGRTLREFKRAQESMETLIKAEMLAAERDDRAKEAEKVAKAAQRKVRLSAADEDADDDAEDDAGDDVEHDADEHVAGHAAEHDAGDDAEEEEDEE